MLLLLPAPIPFEAPRCGAFASAWSAHALFTSTELSRHCLEPIRRICVTGRAGDGTEVQMPISALSFFALQLIYFIPFL